MSEPAEGGAERPGLWQVKIAFLATPAQHEELLDGLADVLCPEPDHEGPCPVPWGMHSVNGDSLSRRRRRALLKEIEETNWDPKDSAGTDTGTDPGTSWRPA
ncbi:hypothetical protein [Streptomyces sp. NPDC001508]|uniref:hypothetical protein n=1 Tax=Streptomyces sp. NPDC001508 TaxID=3154656 RepID=UPI003332CE28